MIMFVSFSLQKKGAYFIRMSTYVTIKYTCIATIIFYKVWNLITYLIITISKKKIY